MPDADRTGQKTEEVMTTFRSRARAIVAFSIALCVAACAKSPTTAPNTHIGEEAVRTQLQRADGKRGSIGDYRGRVLVLNVWASWCDPCVTELPDLQRLSSTYGSRGLTVIGLDQGESLQVVQAFAKAHNISFPLFVDTNQVYGKRYAFSVVGMPATLIVDRHFRIVSRIDGLVHYDTASKVVESIL